MKLFFQFFFIILFIIQFLKAENSIENKKVYIKEIQGSFSKVYLLNVVKKNINNSDNSLNSIFFTFLIVRNKNETGDFTLKETKDYLCNGISYQKMTNDMCGYVLEPHTLINSSEKWLNHIIEKDSKFIFLLDEKSICMTIEISGTSIPENCIISIKTEVGWNKKTEDFNFEILQKDFSKDYPVFKMTEWEKTLYEAIHCYKRVNYNDGINFITKAINISEKKYGNKSKEIIISLTWYGALLCKINDYLNAKNQLLKALLIIDENNYNNLEQKPVIYSLLSELDKKTFNDIDSQKNKNFALQEWEELTGNIFDKNPFVYFKIADKYRVDGMFEVSNILYEKTLQLYENFLIENKLIIDDVNNNVNNFISKDTAILFADLGWIHHLKKNKDLAYKFYKTSLNIFEKIKITDDWHLPVLEMRIKALKNMNN